MQTCNYQFLDTTKLDPDSFYFDDFDDLDILHTEEGMLINIAKTMGGSQ